MRQLIAGLQGRRGRRTHGRRTVSELAVHRAKWKCKGTMNGDGTAMTGISTEKKIDSVFQNAAEQNGSHE